MSEAPLVVLWQGISPLGRGFLALWLLEMISVPIVTWRWGDRSGDYADAGSPEPEQGRVRTHKWAGFHRVGPFPGSTDGPVAALDLGSASTHRLFRHPLDQLCGMVPVCTDTHSCLIAALPPLRPVDRCVRPDLVPGNRGSGKLFDSQF